MQDAFITTATATTPLCERVYKIADLYMINSRVLCKGNMLLDNIIRCLSHPSSGRAEEVFGQTTVASAPPHNHIRCRVNIEKTSKPSVKKLDSNSGGLKMCEGMERLSQEAPKLLFQAVPHVRVPSNKCTLLKRQNQHIWVALNPIISLNDSVRVNYRIVIKFHD